MAALIDAGGGMTLLPPPTDCCQICAVKHEPHLPHNAQSIFYQVRFKIEHGRDATWHDAMEHCSEEMKALWKTALAEKGVDIDKGVHPQKGS